MAPHAMIRALLVGDDELHREPPTDEQSKQGFVIRGFSESASLLGLLHAADADVVVLDRRLPKTSGIVLPLQSRRHGVNLRSCSRPAVPFARH